MAKYFHLNLYKTAIDLLTTVTNLITKFNRDFRYTLGQRLQDYIADFVVLIYKANSAQNTQKRCEYIADLIEKLQYINVFIRLSCEVKAISKEKYIELTKITEDLQMQLSGWQSYSLGRIAQEKEEHKAAQKQEEEKLAENERV